MPIRVQCDYCNYSFLVRDALANRHCKCPRCSQVIHIPGPGDELAGQIFPSDPLTSGDRSHVAASEETDAGGTAGNSPGRTATRQAQVRATPCAPASPPAPPTSFAPVAEPNRSREEHRPVQPSHGHRLAPSPPTAGRYDSPGDTAASPSAKKPERTAVRHRDRPSARPKKGVARLSTDSHPSTDEERRQLARRILAAFQGPIEPVRRPGAYIASMIGALVVLLILPLCYVLLVAAVGYATYAYAVFGSQWIFSIGITGRAALLLYLGPLVTGAIMVVFMVKPFFAPRPKQPDTLSLTPEAEPLLFLFVEKVCQTVRAPLPRRIDIDCDVNASASFRRGLLSFFGNDLVLTIGLPLVGGMTMNQFAGVLAHEFGHFSQGAAMRLTYLVRSIAGWFHRIATERDAWDEWLIETSKNVDLRIGVFLYLARALVFCSRLILFGLMLVGWAVIGILLRQMEFDADRHEIRLAGSTTFRETFHRLRRLSVAARLAENAMEKLLSEGRLPDDYPALVQHQEAHIPPDLWQEVEKRVQEESTGWWDTHPCDRDRLQAADKEAAIGVFHVDLPASLLFSDFPRLCRAATADWYRYALEDRFSSEMLYPVGEFTRRLERQADADQAFFRFLQGPIIPGRRMPLIEIEKAQTVQELITAIQEGRRVSVERSKEYENWIDQYQEALATELSTTFALLLCEGGGKLGPTLEKYGKTYSKLQQARDEARATQQRLGQQISQWEEAAMRRLTAGLRLLGNPKVRQRGQITDAQVSRVKSLIRLYKLLEKHFRTENYLYREGLLLQISLAALEDNQITQQTWDQLINQMRELASYANTYRSHFEAITFPLEHSQQGISVAQYLCESAVCNEPLKALVEVHNMVGKIHELRANLLAELIKVAEQVEKAIGFEPLPERAANEPGTD